MTTNNNDHNKPMHKVRLFFTGLTMGLADLVPGVSGGTIALLFGIYEELLKSVRSMTGKVPKLMLSGKFKQAFQIIPFGFLLPVGLGIGSAIIGLSPLVSYLLDTQPVLVWSLFFGLVVGSAYVISHRIDLWTAKRIALLLAGFAATFTIVGLPALGGSSSPLAVFASGAIAITAMILPGISGSLILVLLGQYEVVINAVSERDLATLAFFAIGAVTGLAIFVRILTWLLRHYEMAVIALLVGVMVGSLRRLWPWQESLNKADVTYMLPELDSSSVAALALMITGFSAVFLLGRIGVAKKVGS